MKTLLSWIVITGSVGGTVYVASPRCDDARTELHRHMDACPVCARSPFRCDAARKLGMKQAPWPGGPVRGR